MAPIVHLVKQVLHKDRSLEDNVRRLRWKRRKAKPVCQHLNVNDGVMPDEGYMVICKDCGADLSPGPIKKEVEP